MRIHFGFNAYAKHTQNRLEPVVWDSHQAMNGHILIMGGSGSGKTHTLRNMITSMARSGSGLRLHVFDVHGDIEPLPDSCAVKFSEQTGYGYNPLKLSDCIDSGGVRRRIQSFIGALKRTSRPLGSRQEAVLRALLTDLYAANGFYEDKPGSWRLEDGLERKFAKKYPTLIDACRFTQAKLRCLYLGGDTASATQLEQVNRKIQSVYSQLKALGQLSPEAIKNHDELNKLKRAAINSYQAAVMSLGTGRELDDLLRYDSKDVLRSVYERLDNLHATGVFRPEAPPFDDNATVWRYDVKNLREDEQKLLVYCRLEELFQQAVAAGVQKDIRHIIVLDEAKRFFNDEADNPLNVIAAEGRKFGLALVCASQSPTHFSEEFLANVATKLLLRLDEMYWDSSVRKLKIELKTLKYIVPRKTMAIQMKTSNGDSARFVGVDIAGTQPADAIDKVAPIQQQRL